MENDNLYAAFSYLEWALYGQSIGDEDWPFEKSEFKDYGYVGNLKKVKEYIDKEIERVSRS